VKLCETKKISTIIEQTKERVNSQALQEKYRTSPTDWTRERKLPFAKTVTLVLSGHKRPLQNNLNKFFQDMDETTNVPTASAYCQARRKFKGELFLYLNEETCGDFYQQFENELELWQGRRVLAVDGTHLNLPDSPETRARFSLVSNQHQGGERVQALASVIYDLLNDIGLNLAFGKKQAEKQFLFTAHLAYMHARDLIVLDRNYGDYSVMAFLLKNNCDFLIRFQKNGFKCVKEFFAGKAKEKVVELAVTSLQKQFVRENELAEKLKLRLIKVVLDNGEIEVVGTNLMAAQREEIIMLYGLRWGIETYFDRIKNIFELERFSGNSLLSIEQDVYATLFLATLESILSSSAEEELAEESSECQYPQQVNHSVSYSAILDHMTDLLMNEELSVEQTVAQLHRLFMTNPTLRRKGRNYPRRPRSGFRQLYYHKYSKRIIA